MDKKIRYIKSPRLLDAKTRSRDIEKEKSES
jgi:hypothetical protein